jgi:hypothetical protein
LASAGESRRLAELVPPLLGAVLIALLTSGAGGSSARWFFQSPISPLTPGPVSSPSAPQATVAGPALVSVPAAHNLIPWLVGILLVAAIVGAAMLWSRRKEKGEGST